MSIKRIQKKYLYLNFRKKIKNIIIAKVFDTKLPKINSLPKKELTLSEESNTYPKTLYPVLNWQILSISKIKQINKKEYKKVFKEQLLLNNIIIKKIKNKNLI